MRACSTYDLELVPGEHSLRGSIVATVSHRTLRSSVAPAVLSSSHEEDHKTVIVDLTMSLTVLIARKTIDEELSARCIMHHVPLPTRRQGPPR